MASLSTMVVGIIAVIIALSVGIAVMAQFNHVASDVVASTNDTQAQSAYSNVVNIGWNSMTLLSVGILAAVGFAIISMIRGGE